MRTGMHSLLTYITVHTNKLCACDILPPPPPPPSVQLHGNVKEDLEQLRLEEAALQRRQKLQSREKSVGVANGGRLSDDSKHTSLSQLQRKRRELGWYK